MASSSVCGSFGEKGRHRRLAVSHSAGLRGQRGMVEGRCRWPLWCWSDVVDATAWQGDERRSVGAVHLRGPMETFLLLFLVGTRRERAGDGKSKTESLGGS
jgi:hypothetical protein